MDKKIDEFITRFKALKEELNKNVNGSYSPGTNESASPSLAMAESNLSDSESTIRRSQLIEDKGKKANNITQKPSTTWVRKGAKENFRCSEHGQWSLDKGAVTSPSVGDGPTEVGRKKYNAKIIAGNTIQPKPVAPPKIK
jgi:hypothetical protein